MGSPLIGSSSCGSLSFIHLARCCCAPCLVSVHGMSNLTRFNLRKVGPGVNFGTLKSVVAIIGCCATCRLESRLVKARWRANLLADEWADLHHSCPHVGQEYPK